MPLETVRVVAHITAKPEKIEETLEALTALIAPTRAEEGCIAYELLQDIGDATSFTFVEEWSSSESLNAHFETEHLQQILAKVDQLLAAAPDIRRYKVIA